MTDATLVLAGVPTPPVARRPLLLLAAVALTAALLLLQVQGVVPRLVSDGATSGRATDAPADVGAAAASAQATRVGPGRDAGVLEARDPAYRAEFDERGFSYLPTGASAPLRIDLAGVAVGGEPVDLALGAWSADGSVLERRIAPALTERVTARDGEVEWDVVVDRPLPGSGDLVVEGELSGTAGGPVARGRAVEVPLDGATVPIGEVVVKDVGGTVLHRALPEVTGEAIRLVVPAAALDGARYPVTVDPTVGERQTLSGTGRVSDPAIAWSGGPDGTHLVAWAEPVAGQYDIYGAVISDDGVGRTAPRQLSFASTDDFSPDVAWSGGSFLVVFEQPWPPDPTDSDIRGQRVDKNGTLIGTTIGIVTNAAGQADPAITATSTGFTIAWSDDRAGSQDRWKIYAGRYTPEGAPRDGEGVRISTNSEPPVTNEYGPDVAWNGTATMVVWYEQGGGNYHVRTARLFADGTRDLTTNGSARTGHDYQVPAIASDGDKWLVVFMDTTASTGAVDILGLHLDAGNTHTGTFPISQLSTNEDFADVAYGGGQFLVVLTDRRFPNDPDVRAIRLNRNAAKLETDTFFVESATNENDSPVVAPGRQGGWAVGYEDGTDPQTTIRWRSVSK